MEEVNNHIAHMHDDIVSHIIKKKTISETDDDTVKHIVKIKCSN